MQQEEVGGRRAYFLATVESVCKRKLAEYNQEGAEGEVCRQNQSRVKLLRLKLDPFVIIYICTKLLFMSPHFSQVTECVLPLLIISSSLFGFCSRFLQRKTAVADPDKLMELTPYLCPPTLGLVALLAHLQLLVALLALAALHNINIYKHTICTYNCRNLFA